MTAYYLADAQPIVFAAVVNGTLISGKADLSLPEVTAMLGALQRMNN